MMSLEELRARWTLVLREEDPREEERCAVALREDAPRAEMSLEEALPLVSAEMRCSPEAEELLRAVYRSRLYARAPSTASRRWALLTGWVPLRVWVAGALPLEDALLPRLRVEYPAELRLFTLLSR